jgi:hypothetical protein
MVVSLDMMMNQMSLLGEWIDETRKKGVQFSNASGIPSSLTPWIIVWTALS